MSDKTPNYVNGVPDGYAGKRCQHQFGQTGRPLSIDIRDRPCGYAVEGDGDMCIFHGDGKRRDIKERLEEAVAAGVCLVEANLQDASLDNADLKYAILHSANLTGADLYGADLTGAVLNNALLRGADFTTVCLRAASLIQADFADAQLENVDLDCCNATQARFTGACSLRQSTFIGALLAGADFSAAADLDGVVWWVDPRGWLRRILHIAPPTLTDEALVGQLRQWAGAYWSVLEDSERTCRQIKRAYQASGQYDKAGEFFIREMEYRRKQERNPLRRGGLGLLYFLSDYFEDPWRVGIIGLVIVAVFAWVQGSLGICDSTGAFVLGPGWCVPNPGAVLTFFSRGLYFSIVTFTTLGYGDYHAATDVGRIISSLEAMLGAILLAMFLVCLARKYGRS
ncbi:MAG: pentapeptide repeat-containing protein [Armatimonadetes bacterium]|nr:pentapeptide repeat-containing protein [Armatimonadota bacterium]